jgi:hypothetical protein
MLCDCCESGIVLCGVCVRGIVYLHGSIIFRHKHSLRVQLCNISCNVMRGERDSEEMEEKEHLDTQ